MRRGVGLGLLAALAAALGLLGSSPLERAEAQELPKPKALPVYLGVGSCAAVACHFQPEPAGAKGAEYTTWVTHDRHANAYLVLLNDRSKHMVRNLYGPDAKPATEQALCLKCHSLSVPDAQRGPRFQLDDGVGCERCHGAAENWVADHFRPAWTELSDEEKEKRGMRDLKDLDKRVQLCAECHVGSPGYDVNHDLIAAGHPRLVFEFASYQMVMPRHWSEAADKERYPDFEYRAWALGQATCAEAALKLLAHRAGGKLEDDKPWPEFAEYACFACHHDLKEKSWRQERGYGDRLPGSIPYSHWYTAVLPQALQGLPEGERKPFQDALEQLNQEMSKAAGDRENIAGQATKCARLLRPLIRQVAAAKPKSAAEVKSAFADAVRGGPALVEQGWDEAAQLYLALAAQYYALSDLDRAQCDPKVTRALKAIVPDSKLKFPTKGERYDSPRDFSPKQFLDLLGNINKDLR